MLEAYDRKLMENRDKKKYRHKGLRETSVNTVMREIKYKRVMYEIQEEGITKTVYLFEKIQPAIDGLKYELNGEYQAVKKLNKLES